jgi:hypothetical protein
VLVSPSEVDNRSFNLFFSYCSFRLSTNKPYLFKMQAREFLSTLGDLSQTQIFAKIENVEVNCISS